MRAAVADYAARYDAMFARQNARVGNVKTKLDAMPRVVLVPGVGLFGIGATAKDAAIAADLAENAIRVITDAEAIGRYEPLGEADLFDVEYWSLEQAKLKGAVAKAFTGQVAVVTGAGSGIGLATAKAFAAEGAAVAVLDMDERRPPRRRPRPSAAWRLACDVTDRASVRAAFARDRRALRRRRHRRVECGRGLAGQDRRGGRRRCCAQSFELNFFAHQAVAQAAVAHHAEAGHRRRAAVQRLQAGGEPRPRFRALRPAEGGDAGADAPVRHRLRRARASAPTASTPTASAPGCSTDDMVAQARQGARA